MITAVLVMLAAEAAFLQSPAIAAWAFFFLIANALWFPLVEEKGLEARFGEDYRRYKKDVPRWIPAIRPLP